MTCRPCWLSTVNLPGLPSYLTGPAPGTGTEVLALAAGGNGGLNPAGGLTTFGNAAQRFHAPGRQRQRNPGTNTHCPKRKGIHPHGYAETQVYPHGEYIQYPFA